MCGIAGYLRTVGEPADRPMLRAMCDRLAHRGPDAYGEFFDGEAALGHRRLSIIDLAGGAQPLGNEDGTIQVVFNGEIYNFKELHRELRAKGHVFETRSDTEVLVHLYEEERERMPERLCGMFAFAIWDGRRRELFLCRDRFGKKPLYYSAAIPGTRFCFASELKSLAAIPEFRPPVDPASVAEFLTLSYVPDPRTIYRDVWKLEPGHSLTVSPHGLRRRKYWEPALGERRTIAPREAEDAIRSLAGHAVAKRLTSEVPLGGFLSGGVDSSAVVALMAGGSSERVKTFSIGFTDPNFDELRYARMVAERYGTEHHERTVTLDIHDMLGRLVEQFDEPFADSSAIPTLYLARMTRERVTVALSGDGADEVFGGYRRYRFGVLEERIRSMIPGWVRRPLLGAGGRYYPKFDYLPQMLRAKSLLTNLAQEAADAYFSSMTAFRDEGLAAVLAPAIKRELAGYSPRESFRTRFQAVRHLSPLEQMQAVDFQTYLPGDILVKADRASMAFSLELRSPWLDHELAELAFALPPGLKLRGGTGKYIFKKALARYVPAAVLERRKMGFAVPLAAWFRSTLKPVFEASVLHPGMDRYLARDAVRRLWTQHQSGLHDHSRKLWTLLTLALWDGAHNPGAEPRRREALARARVPVN